IELNKKTDFFKEKLSDGFSKISFAFPGLTEGAIIEFQYELVCQNITVLDPWYFQNELPTFWSEIRFKIPKYLNYTSLTRNYRPFVYQEKKPINYLFGNKTVDGVLYSAALDSLVPLREEPFITTVEDFRQRMEFQLSLIRQFDGRIDTVMTNWPNFTKELLKNPFLGDQINKLSKHRKVKLAATTLLANLPNSETPVQDLYDYVQGLVKWDQTLSIFAETSLDQALDARQANSGEMNMMLIYLLREAGYEAHPFLISTRSHGKVKKQYPIARQFNHLITAVKLDNQWRLIDVSDSDMSISLLPDYCLNTEGLLLDTEGPKWLPIQAPISKSRTGISVKLHEGKFKVNVQSKDEAYSAIDTWESYYQQSEADFFARWSDEEFEITKAEIISPKEDPTTFVMQLSFEKEWEESNGIVYLDPLFGSSLSDNPFDSEQRSLPVDFPYPVKIEYVASIQLPQNAEVLEIPKPIRIELPDKNAAFEYQITHSGPMIQVRTQLIINKTFYSPDQFQHLRELYDYLLEKQNELIVLKIDSE
ncbi:MAG: transglutaminase domain-containing protein, partial [Bacteroidota bacterium]